MLLERWKTWTSKVWSKTDTISAGRVFSRNFFVSLPIKFLLRFFQCPLAPSLAKTFLSMPAYETLSLSHTHTHTLTLSLSLSSPLALHQRCSFLCRLPYNSTNSLPPSLSHPDPLTHSLSLSHSHSLTLSRSLRLCLVFRVAIFSFFLHRCQVLSRSSGADCV